MAKILIVGEHTGGKLKPNAGELIGAARQLGSDVHGAVLGHGGAQAAAGLGAYGIASAAAIGTEQTEFSSDELTAALADYVKAHSFDYIIF